MPKKQARPQAPEPKSAELGDTREERNHHLRYAHEQYSGSGQGAFGAPKGRNLALEKPHINKATIRPHQNALAAGYGSSG